MGSCFEDHDEALKQFKHAVNLGIVDAYYFIGKILEEKNDRKNALKFFKKGIAEGDLLCCGATAAYYLHDHHYKNATKAAELFFERIIVDLSWLEDDDRYYKFEVVVNYLCQLLDSRINSLNNDSQFKIENWGNLFLIRRNLRRILYEKLEITKQDNRLATLDIYKSTKKRLNIIEQYIQNSRPYTLPFNTIRYRYFTMNAYKIPEAADHVNTYLNAFNRDRSYTSVPFTIHIREVLSEKMLRQILESEELLDTSYYLSAERKCRKLSACELKFDDYDCGNQVLKFSHDKRKDFCQILALSESFQNFVSIVVAWSNNSDLIKKEIRKIKKGFFITYIPHLGNDGFGIMQYGSKSYH